MKAFRGLSVLVLILVIDSSVSQIEIVIPGFPTFPTFPRPVQKDKSFTSTSNQYPPIGFSTQTQYFGNTAPRLGGGVRSFTSSYPTNTGISSFDGSNYNGGGIHSFASSYPTNTGRSFAGQGGIIGVDDRTSIYRNSNGYGYGGSNTNYGGFAGSNNGRRYDDVESLGAPNPSSFYGTNSFNKPQGQGDEFVSYSHNVRPLNNNYN